MGELDSYCNYVNYSVSEITTGILPSVCMCVCVCKTGATILEGTLFSFGLFYRSPTV